MAKVFVAGVVSLMITLATLLSIQHAPQPEPVKETDHELLILHGYDSISPLLPDWDFRITELEEGLKGSTGTNTRIVELDSDLDESEHAKVLSHEIGHAFDVTYLTDDQREEWKALREYDSEVPWWPGNGLNDFSTGAGDWAECFSWWLGEHTDFKSKLGNPPTRTQMDYITEIVELASE